MAGPERLPPQIVAPPRRTVRDLLVDLAGVPEIGDELEFLGELLADLEQGPSSESSGRMLESRVHDQLDRICELLGRDTV